MTAHEAARALLLDCWLRVTPGRLDKIAAALSAAREAGQQENDAIVREARQWAERRVEEASRLDMASALKRAEQAEAALENERQKVAGCSTAALGYWKEGDSLHADYECAAIHDVAALYARLTQAEADLARLRAVIAKGGMDGHQEPE